ncbi:MAG: AraC family ligand binding domain-containing protein [Candidatus Dormibacteria bacterium]
MLKIDLATVEGAAIDRFGSQAATHARIAEMGQGSAVGVIRLGRKGRLGRHPATVAQLMVTLSGSGYVRGDGAPVQRIRAGDAVVWSPGEEHETWTDAGMVLLIVETDDPHLGMAHR